MRPAPQGRVTGRRPPGGRDERGATLIFVLVFMLVAGLLLAGLLDATTSDLRNTQNFAAARTVDNNLAEATDLAIQSLRYTPPLTSPVTVNASPPVSCLPSTTPALVTGIAVWCSTAWNPTSTATRVVTLSTCFTSASPNAAASCAANPSVQAVVTFDDYPAGVSAPTTSECSVYCGTGETVDRWVQEPVPPTVTGIRCTGTGCSGSTTESNTTGGSELLITGTGFGAGDTVNFVPESGGVPSTTGGVPPSATGVSVLSSVSIEAVTPAITLGTTYFVVVATPSGTSPYSSSAVFTYTPLTPTLTSLSTPNINVPDGTGCRAITGSPADPTNVVACSSTAGGTAVTITGAGFVSTDVVSFVEESGGTPSSPAVSLQVPQNYTTVSSSSSITVVCPPITVGTTYFVEVTTPGVGTSPAVPAASSGTNTNNTEFWYFPVVPVVAAVSPASGGAGTQVTITGTGFFTGATVAFCPESGGTPTGQGGSCSSNQSAATIVSSIPITATSITVKTPTLTGGGGHGGGVTTYFITVTTPAGGTDNVATTPIYTY